MRLKGGDPFVFGRGGDEAEALQAAGIRYEVVPGVTAGIAAAAYAGIPVTHREAASAVAFLAGHEDPDKAEAGLDWRALAAFPGTLVVYMGVRRLGAIAQRLIEGGRSEDEPAALVRRATFPDQRPLHATLGTIAQRSPSASGITAPAIAHVRPRRRAARAARVVRAAAAVRGRASSSRAPAPRPAASSPRCARSARA